MSNESFYTFGNCTWYVAQQLPWVPPGWGDAGDWLNNAIAKGFNISKVPVVGSVVVYGRGGGYSPFGHVAIVTAVHPTVGTKTGALTPASFDVREMNFSAFDQVDSRTSSMGDVLGFILPPGTQGSVGGNPNDNVANDALQQALGPVGDAVRAASQDWLNTLLWGSQVVFGGVLMLVAVAIMVLNALPGTGVAQMAGKALPGPAGMVARAASKGRGGRSPRVPLERAEKPAEAPKREESPKTRLRREIAQAKRDRRSAGASSKAWVDATVRLNMARNKLKESE